jgi:hypothetical protein
MIFPSIPADKANHAVYGAAIACVGALTLGPVAGAVACLLVAVGKELYDRISGTGCPELLDTAWTLVGGALVLAPLTVEGWA